MLGLDFRPGAGPPSRLATAPHDSKSPGLVRPGFGADLTSIAERLHSTPSTTSRRYAGKLKQMQRPLERALQPRLGIDDHDDGVRRRLGTETLDQPAPPLQCGALVDVALVGD